jgi:hypothetical protein
MRQRRGVWIEVFREMDALWTRKVTNLICLSTARLVFID